MIKYFSRLKKNEEGQSIVEFALVFVFVLMPVLFGIFEFGRIFGGSLIVSHAAREGARAGVVSMENERLEAINNAVQSNSFFLNIEPFEASEIQGLDGEPGERLTVTVSYDMDLVVPNILDMITNPINLESQAIMRIE